MSKKTIEKIERKYKKGGYKTYRSYVQAKNSLFRRQLRKKPTKEELIFKKYLEDVGISAMFQKGFIVPFNRIVDFYIPKLKLIIEIDGGYHETVVEKDRHKDKEWLKRGIKTLRITNKQINDGSFKVVLSLNK